MSPLGRVFLKALHISLIYLPVVSFLYPVIPVLFIVVGIVITIFGMTFEPKISLVAMLTVATGALVYHFRLRTRRA